MQRVKNSWKCIEMLLHLFWQMWPKHGHCVNWCLPLNREAGGEKLQLPSEAVLLRPLPRRPGPLSLWGWSFRPPSPFFSPVRLFSCASVLFATLAVIYCLRTPCKTNISRNHTRSLCFHSWIITSGYFEKKKKVFSLHRVRGWFTTCLRV